MNFKRTIKTVIKDPIPYFTARCRDLKYWVHNLFCPWNVVKISNLPRSWSDRDEVMFHAVFQIFVDYIELEHPFAEWTSNLKGRFKDVKAMRAQVDARYGESCYHQWYADWSTDAEKEASNKRVDEMRAVYHEMLDIYEWYTGKNYDFDADKSVFRSLGESLAIDVNGRIITEDTGMKKLISWEFYYESEIKHAAHRNHMLNRVINLREYMWT